jgi:hypothetical protein
MHNYQVASTDRRTLLQSSDVHHLDDPLCFRTRTAWTIDMTMIVIMTVMVRPIMIRIYTCKTFRKTNENVVKMRTFISCHLRGLLNRKSKKPTAEESRYLPHILSKKRQVETIERGEKTCLANSICTATECLGCHGKTLYGG